MFHENCYNSTGSKLKSRVDMYIRYLFEDGLQALQHLFLFVSQNVRVVFGSVCLTSSSILASAISCSLPLPLAIFWASAIWERTFCVEGDGLALRRGQSTDRLEPTSMLNSSRGKPSTALMLSWESGWTTAKPPDTRIHEKSCQSCPRHDVWRLI